MTKISAGHLNNDHIGLSIAQVIHPYVTYGWDRPEGRSVFIEPRTVFCEIRMISHTSKGTVKVRTPDGGDLTLGKDVEVEVRRLPRRKALGMRFGHVEREGGEMEIMEPWRSAVYPSDGKAKDETTE